MFDIIIGLSIISLVALIHEFGHYLFARIAKVGVEIFSVGMGKPLVSYKDLRGTTWKIGSIPFGGYILPKENDEAGSNHPKAFFEFGHVENNFVKGLKFKESGPIKGIFVAIAGPFFNFLTAFFLLIFISNNFGFPNYTNKIESVESNSPAEFAGLKKDDVIKTINNKNIKNKFDIKMQKNDNSVLIERNGKLIELNLNKNNANLNNKNHKKYGLLLKTEFKKIGFFQSISLSFKTVVTMIYLTLTNIVNAITSMSISGPIGIIEMASKQSKNGLLALLFFIIDISIGIGAFNLFPIPVLDGGRIVLFLISAIIRKPVPKTVENILNYIGFGIVIGIFALTFFIDIKGLIN